MLKSLFENYGQLLLLKDEIEKAIRTIIECYTSGGKLLLCGNGGSAADCEHIVGELMKGFLLKRKIEDEKLPNELRENLQGSLPALSLVGALSLSTAFANDVNPNFVFAQQVYGLGNKNDVLIGISTSGNAKNVCNAVLVAKQKGLKTVALTGKNDSELSQICDITIKAPATQTYRIQEYHLPIYHAICAEVEDAIFGKTRLNQ